MLESIRIKSFWRRTLVVGFVWMGLALYVQPANAQLQCTLGAASAILLNTELGPLALGATGRMDVACSEGSERECSCDIDELDPLSIPGVGFVCIAPAEGCPGGTYSCDGGPPLDVFLEANHVIDMCVGDCNADGFVAVNELVIGINIASDLQPIDNCPSFGAAEIDDLLTGVGNALSGGCVKAPCTGNADCNTQCEAYCEGKGMATGGGRGCEGFCTDGAESECFNDAECIEKNEGSCSGPDAVPFGNVCECQCLDRALGDTSPPGSFSCMLGSDLVVEIAAPCDGMDVLIVVGSQCIPLTSTIHDGIILNSNPVPGPPKEILPAEDTNPGSPLTCSDFDSGTLSGLKVGGEVAFFGSALGDILSTVVVDCE